MSDSEHRLPAAVAGLRPAAKHIFDHLRWAEDDRLTVEDVRRLTGYSQRTIRRATADLEAAGVIESRWRESCPRERVFVLV
jgi:DNA-binding transcriptional ArsR family regulator